MIHTPGKNDVPLAASSITGRLALWSIRHRRRVLLIWLVLTIAGLGACFRVPANIEDEGTGESQKAAALFEERFGENEEPLTELLIISHDSLSVNSRVFRSLVNGLVADLRALRTRETFDVLGTNVEGSLRFVADTTTHYTSGLPRASSTFVSRNETGSDITFVLIELEPEFDDAVDGVGIFTEVVDRAAAANPEFGIAVGGIVTAVEQLETILEDDFAKSSAISLPITAVILILAFGTLAAAVFPLAVGLPSSPSPSV